MSELCSTPGNTGANDCKFPMKIIKRAMFVNMFDSSGDPTKIANADLTKAALQLKFNESEAQDRFYPLPLFNNVTDERAEATFFEWDGGGKEFIKENPRAFTGHLKYISPELIGRIKSWNQGTLGMYAWDADGNFIYSKDTTGGNDYYPIELDAGSLYAGMIKATNAEPYMAMVQFDTSDSFKDEDIRLVKAADLDFNGLSTTDVYGLTETYVNIVSADTSSVVFTVKFDQNVVVSGLLSANFTANNDTDDASVTLTGVTESAVTPGTYTGAYSSGVTAGDTLRITVNKDRLSPSYDTFVATS